MNYQKIIKESEIYLRQGQLSLASKIFLNIQLSKVPLNDVVSVARLGRRTGHISDSLKFLQKHISKKQNLQSKEFDFIAEYAILLTLHSCVNEALNLLEKMDISNHSEAQLAKSWCFFEIWEHQKAIPLLMKYLSVQVDPYERIIGNINLA